MKFYFIIILLFATNFCASAQQFNIPINNQMQMLRYAERYDTASNDFSVVMPFIQSFINYKTDYTPPFRVSYSKGERKLTRENLILLKKDSLTLTIDPLFNFESTIVRSAKRGTSKKQKYTKNTRGVWIRGSLGSKFSFESSFLENQVKVVDYIDTLVKQEGVFPGMGRTKVFKTNGFDFAMASGYLSYTPIKNLNVQFGHGKMFIGNGYRSLLLSDNSFNYPHTKVTYQYKKLYYSWVVASLINLKKSDRLSVFSEPLFQKRNATFHTLSFKPTRRYEVSFFQGVVYDAANKNFNWNVVNPLIYSQAITYGLATKNNVVLGFNFNAKIKKKSILYAQIMCDDFNNNRKLASNKTGYQIGVLWNDFVRIRHLSLRLERNSVRPYSYQQNLISQSYTHYNQGLAHPLNANFREFVLIANYAKSNFMINVKLVSANIGTDTSKFNAGSYLFNSTEKYIQNANFGNVKMLQGKVSNLLSQDFNVAYLINPSYNFTMKFGYFARYYDGNKTSYIYINLSANIFNQYLDF